MLFIHYIIRYKTSQELVTHDSHSNTYTYKYTFSVEIVPVCKVNFASLNDKQYRRGQYICHKIVHTIDQKIFV